jgi:hypothetical protein
MKMKMKKTILGIAAVMIVSLLLQSCFEIKEIIKINKDGSGTFSMVIDMTEVKALLESFGEDESDESSSPLGEMEKDYEITKGKLEVIDGISNITFLTENDGYMITTSFDFTNIDALNRGINVVYEEDNEVGEQTEYYKYKKKNFERTSSHKLLEELKGEMGSEEFAGDDMDLGEIFTDVAFINEVTFTDRTIKKTSNEAIEISDDGSTLTLKRFIFREDEDLSMDYTVKVK